MNGLPAETSATIVEDERRRKTIPIEMTAKQVEMQALHHAPERLFQKRSRRVNQVQGFLTERGTSDLVRSACLPERVRVSLEARTLVPCMLYILSDMAVELVEIVERVTGLDTESGKWISHEQTECIEAATVVH